MFLVDIDTDGDAFANGAALRETARILNNIAAALQHMNAETDAVMTARDVNGNTCAVVRYVPETASE